MKYDLSKEFDRNKAMTYMTNLIAKDAKIELKEFRPKRTLNQNNYWHCIVTLLGNHIGQKLDEMKVDIKRDLEFMQYSKNGKRYLRSSRDLDKAEFTQLVDYTRTLGESLGCYLPTSEEYLTHQFEL